MFGVTNGQLNIHCRSFPGGSVVGSLPASAGDAGLIPSLGKSHMLQSN